jgi:predicted HicB family RNase H-like nuclease
MAHDSRTAPKFVVRYASPEQRDAVAAAAEDKHIAINSFICQAIDEKLARGAAMDLVIEIAHQRMVEP